MKKFPKAIEDFGSTFIAMQEKRHAADYDPFISMTKSAVYFDIVVAEQAIDAFKQVPVKHRRAFCAYVLLKDRSS